MINPQIRTESFMINANIFKGKKGDDRLNYE